MSKTNAFASFLLRAGLASVFLYAAVSQILVPAIWIGFLPSGIAASRLANASLLLFSLFEIALALWLFSNKKIYAAAIVSAATLLAIVVQNITALDIVFRDIAIFFAAIALAVLAKEK